MQQQQPFSFFLSVIFFFFFIFFTFGLFSVHRSRRCAIKYYLINGLFFSSKVKLETHALLVTQGCILRVLVDSEPEKMMSFEMNDRKKIGLGLTGFGVFFSFLGIIFFFDKGLLAMGNILFFSGVALTIGLKSSAQFFMKRSNFKGTVSFGVGFFLIVIGWPIIGMIVEAYGFIVLFSGFWPTLAVFMQKIPVLGWLFQQPFIRSFFDRYRGKRVPV